MNTEVNESGTSYTTENEVVDHITDLEVNDTLYAQWNELEQYTITFNTNGGTVDPTNITVYEGETINEFPTPTREGYLFNCRWTGVNDGNRQYTPYITTQNKTLYAHRKKICTVIFNLNGGTLEEAIRE